MDHEYYMRQALELAQQALTEGEVPVGCVIVQGERIVGRGRNRRETGRTALGHGGGDTTGLRGPGGLAAEGLYALCNLGALSHVRGGDSQRADSSGSLWGQG